MELENIKVEIDTAISCGLIVNELITNSLKYAFPDKKEGNISVKLYKINDLITLEVSDNGVGFKLTDQHDGGLGLQMFNLISESQLKAKTEVKINEGVFVRLSFKDDKYIVK